MLTRNLIALGLAAFACPAAFAQDYFDFGQIPGVPAEPAIQIDLNPAMLGIAAAAARAENPAAADLLAGVEGVRVRIYSDIQNLGDVLGFVDNLSGRLASASWQQVVSVQDDAQVRVYMQGSGETVTGVIAVVVHEGKAVFVNAVGSLSGEQLAQSVASLSQGGFNPAMMFPAIGGAAGFSPPN